MEHGTILRMFCLKQDLHHASQLHNFEIVTLHCGYPDH